MSNQESIKNLLTRNVEEVIEKEHLEEVLLGGKKLRVKFGIDPTASELHLGHAVILKKLKEFQNLGHKIVLIIGDFTARIGDPSGRDKTRLPLTEREVKINMKNYLRQAGKIIDVKKTEIKHNSEWFSKGGIKTIIELASAGSFQQVSKRADFRKRLDAGQDITLLEILYPLFQGYDSVKVAADVEVGGTDQKFNLLMGRQVQKHFNRSDGKEGPVQDIIMMPLLVGTDGEKKMSKSYENYITLEDEASGMFGKIMSIPDKSVGDYFKLCTELSGSEIDEIEHKLNKNPRDLKARLAFEIVKLYHGGKKAEEAQKNFGKLFSGAGIPEDLPVYELANRTLTSSRTVATLMVVSNSEARRLVEQGAVEINGKVEKNPKEIIKFKGGETVRIGKKNFFRIKVK